MTVQGWIIFAGFWVVFVTTPGPNAVNCISNGMSFGLRRGLWAVLAILTQATAFLILSAYGLTALLLASPTAFSLAKLIGAAVLIFLGIRGWMMAGTPPKLNPAAGSIYGRALAIATINAKSVAGYLAAFSQFVQPDVPIWDQMAVIMPTALGLTALSYTGYCLGCCFRQIGDGQSLQSLFAARAGALLYRLWAFARRQLHAEPGMREILR